jgi:stress response protein YsnF
MFRRSALPVDPVNPLENDILRVPVFQENVHVDKRLVDTGRGVRIHKTVAEIPVHIDERLLSEAIDVTRVPVDRIVALDQAPQTRYEGDTMIVPILEEVLVVERRLRIKEELHITKTRRETHHTDTVLLKTEQVEVLHFDETHDNPSR